MRSSNSFKLIPNLGVLLSVGVFSLACNGSEEAPATLTAELPLHLEEHLDQAVISGSEIPDNVPAPREWRFDRPQPDWKPSVPIPAEWEAVRPVQMEDALRLPLDVKQRFDKGRLLGGIYIELGDWKLQDWSHVEIRARAHQGLRSIGLEFNYTESDPGTGEFPFFASGQFAPLMDDGTVQTYRLSLDVVRRRWEGDWTHLAIWFNSDKATEASSLDVLSVAVIPRGAEFAQEGSGVRLQWRQTEGRSPDDSPHRRTLFMHTPGSLTYQVRVPEAGRLDFGAGVLRDNVPVTFKVTARRGGQTEALLESTFGDAGSWLQHWVDLAPLQGQEIALSLSAEAETDGTVALWAAPTLSGARKTDKPNIIFYIIDGGSPDYMSVYGYNRRTTPNLERIAAEGALFERAYSNSGWTRPSTPSFLTSLQHSVLGGLVRGRNRVPDQVMTMAEHMHRAGYLTAQLTTNSNAGRMSNLERGVDAFRDTGVDNWSASSAVLHEDFWRWRQDFPAEPYWVHFQTTDVHNEHTPSPPFEGLFISPARRRQFYEWNEQVNAIPETPDFRIREAIQQVGADPVDFWTANRDLHDETMAHQDYQLGQLVERLKASGEWERTLLIIGADHGVAAGTWDFRAFLQDPPPAHVYHDDLGTPMLRSGVSRVPLIIVWPEKIPPELRFSQPVSMLDMLPTVLDLAELPMPEVMMGQSLAPLLLGRPGWEPRPVILDEFEVDDQTGEFRGRIEVVDGRWGASLEINADPDIPPERRRPAPLLVYDLWNDPDCFHSLHEERPDLVEKYTQFLEAQWEAHKALGSRFSRSEDSPLTPEQLETLRSLGYIN